MHYFYYAVQNILSISSRFAPFYNVLLFLGLFSRMVDLFVCMARLNTPLT